MNTEVINKPFQHTKVRKCIRIRFFLCTYLQYYIERRKRKKNIKSHKAHICEFKLKFNTLDLN